VGRHSGLKRQHEQRHRGVKLHCLGAGHTTSLEVLLVWVPEAGAGEGSRGQMRRETEGRGILEGHQT
jgi:hypothetical protein